MTTRRRFLRDSSVAATGAMVFPSILPGQVGRVAPSDRIRVGVIGCNGMGFADLRSILKVPEVECGALCDVDDSVLATRVTEVEASTGIRPTWSIGTAAARTTRACASNPRRRAWIRSWSGASTSRSRGARRGCSLRPGSGWWPGRTGPRPAAPRADTRASTSTSAPTRRTRPGRRTRRPPPWWRSSTRCWPASRRSARRRSWRAWRGRGGRRSRAPRRWGWSR